jgi:hypothetical protein
MAMGVSSALAIACQPLGIGVQPTVPTNPAQALPAVPAMVLDAASLDGAKDRLSGKDVTDFTRTLVSSPTRWGQGAAAKYKIQAFGDSPTGAWASGLNLQAAPFNLAGDFATNGFAVRVMPKYTERVFLVTRNGRFVGIDPNNPTVGFTITNLGGTFSKTYVTLSGDGAVAFVVNDAGTVFAVNVGNTVAGATPSHTVRTVALGASCRGGALYLDPVPPHSAPNYAKSTLHVVDNTGNAHRIGFNVGQYHVMTEAIFAGATFASLNAPVSLTTATPISGTDRVKAPPVVLNGALVVGDRAGNVIRYHYGTGAKTVTQVNYGWPIETPIAVDVDDNLNVIDMFVAAGGQLIWVKPDGTVYMGQYALVQNGGNDARVHAGNFGSYISLTTPTALSASADFQAFSTAQSTDTDAIALPGSANTPTSLDYNRLTHCGFLTGLPPTLGAYAGKGGTQFYNYYPWDPNTGTNAADPVLLTAAYAPPGSGTTRTSFPVQDGESITGANLLSPSAIDWDDDGSSFVADTNHCQVLFNPASASAWQRWFPAGAMTNAAFSWRAGARPDVATTVTYAGTAANSPPESNYYVFAGTLYPHAPNNDGQWSGRDQADGNGANLRRDVGNGGAAPNVAGGGVHVVPPACPANGTTGGTIARGSAINRAQGVAVGNLGLYVANRNAFQSGNTNGQILFMPRAGLPAGTYWGITNPQPGRMYVICNFVDPQGIDVWRDPASATHDVVFAPCMNSSSPNRNKVFRLDSATVNSATTAATAGVTIATLSTTADPYDVGLDDNGNLFIAEHGGDQLRMIAKVVPKNASAPVRNWGTAGVAGTLYTIRTGLNELASVSFAPNDPQVPAGQGCLYLGLGAIPSSSPNRIIRLDETLYHQAVAGPDYGYITGAIPTSLALADAGDGGAGNASTVRLAMPWRARGRFNATNNTYETYICDRGNNRIRRLVSSAGSTNAMGYLSFPMPAAALGKPIYSANLTLYSRTAAGTLMAPEIGLASPYQKNGTAWSNATVTASPASFKPTLAPAVDLVINRAAPTFPNTSGVWNFAVSPGGVTAPYYRWRLPAQAIQTSSTNPALQHLRLGMKTPVDTSFYFYPTSTGVISAPNVKSPEFYTNRNGGTAATFPRVDYTYGNLAMSYPILSPPAIYFKDGDLNGTRYVYVCNANALWRYDVTSPAAFITNANGAEVVFTKSAQGRDPLKGTVNLLTSSFQFNSTPPLIKWDGRVAMVDIFGSSLTSYTYFLNQFDGNLPTATTNMWLGVSKQVAATAPSTVADNAGIYLAADPYFTNAYFGLANGRVYRGSLN